MKIKLNFRRILKDSVQLYFAPITGAAKGIRDEFRRTDQQIAQRADTERKFKARTHA